jgi:hypothetical protein
MGAFLMRRSRSPWETETERRARCVFVGSRRRIMTLSQALAAPVDEIIDSMA